MPTRHRPAKNPWVSKRMTLARRHKRRTVRKFPGYRSKKSIYNVSIKRGIGMGNTAYARLKLNVPTFSLVVPLTGTGSISESILGNSIAPFQNTTTPLIGTIEIPTANWLYQGLQQYAPFYNRYYVLSQKITVRASLITNTTGSPFATQPVEVYCSAYEFNGDGALTNLGPSILDILEPEQIANQKGVIRRTLTPLGNQSSKTITMKRSTKKIMGAADLNDNRNFSGTLDRNLATYSPPSLSGINSPQRQWFYYVRLQNPANQPVAPIVMLSFQIEANILFTDRVVWDLPISVTGGPPPSA